MLSKRTLRSFLLLLLIMGIFLTISLYKIELPGFYEAESYNILPAIDVLYDKPLLDGLYLLDIFGKKYPLMITPFSGTLNSYILVPIGYLFGLTVKTVRMSQVIFAAFGILLTYILCRKIFNEKIAFIAASLLAINPAFVAFNRQGLLINSVDFPLLGLGIFLLLLWRLRKDARYLYASFFVLGLPIFNNVNFLWCLSALTVSYLMLYRDNLRTLFKNKELDRDKAAIAIYFLLFGALPFVWYNTQYWETVKYLFMNLSVYVKENGPLWYFKGLFKSLKILVEILSSGWRPFSWGYGGNIANYLYPVVLLSAFIFTPVVLLKKGDKELLKKTRFVILTLVFILLQSVFALSDLNGYSLYVIYPFAQISIAIFIAELFSFLKDKRALRVLACLFLVFFITMEFFGLRVYFGEINKTGGRGYFSPRIYHLAAFLEKNRHLNPIAMDWGFRYNLWVLSRGRIEAKDFYSMDKDSKDFYHRCDELTRNRSNVYLAHPENIDSKKMWPLFQRYVVSKGLRTEKVEDFSGGNKDEDILLYRIYQ